mmetsp:Transcript_1274/g.3650  ORF Transcript_1274/g.3650 Transcript_1274/m.3650 type:complete len:148 (-) Transcript_1274:84-527(-)
MAQRLQAKLQSKVEEMLEEVETAHMRPLRKTCYVAMAKCCDTPLSRDAFNACLQRASAPEEAASQAVQQEMSQFQNRLQRAAMACQDEVRDKGISNPDRANAHFDRCMCKELDKHIAMLPPMNKRILAAINTASRPASSLGDGNSSH